MRKIRLAMISIGVVIFTGLLLLGGLYLYAVQGSIPRGRPSPVYRWATAKALMRSGCWMKRLPRY
ncbi:hypothetical protein HMSSN036_24460 [Paenibacillus macerans]|nr:hypothetical protein HMSSN036_24460 [Paenibacillus macerans]